MNGQKLQKRRNNLMLSKEEEIKMSKKATTRIRRYSKHSPMKEFALIFKILQLIGIKTFDCSDKRYGISSRDISTRNTEHKTFSCIKAYEYFIFILVCSKIFLNLLWVWLLPDKVNEFTHIFLVAILVLCYVSIYRRRRVLFRMAECITRIYRKLPPRSVERYKYLLITSFVFLEITTIASSVMLIYAEKNTSESQKSESELKLFMDSLSVEVSYCFLLARSVEILFYCITFAVLSLFTMYYGLACRFICSIIQRLLNKYKNNCLLQDVEGLIDIHGDIENCMSYMDEKLSFPAFLLVVMNMSGLFWASYKIVYFSDMNNYFFISMIYFTIFHSLLQLVMIISASITNELATKLKHFVRRLPYLFPTRHSEIKFKLKQNVMQDNYLTLWNIYVIHRSLIIASFGTLLTYGFLIGSLGKES
ncbi:uncharacterized protein TNCT_360151 [Trichonephila clavata]|uniref:Uncharacterized protein n=1 Tax=Trichonephila clavata TaxID=2740835 RepID=A0A8X6F3W9_TRICU|nr:uncharacterized protein TNCT_360151 [Trichonephila clavata]